VAVGNDVKCQCGHAAGYHAARDQRCSATTYNPSTHESDPCRCREFRALEVSVDVERATVSRVRRAIESCEISDGRVHVHDALRALEPSIAYHDRLLDITRRLASGDMRCLRVHHDEVVIDARLYEALVNLVYEAQRATKRGGSIP